MYPMRLSFMVKLQMIVVVFVDIESFFQKILRSFFIVLILLTRYDEHNDGTTRKDVHVIM